MHHNTIPCKYSYSLISIFFGLVTTIGSMPCSIVLVKFCAVHIMSRRNGSRIPCQLDCKKNVKYLLRFSDRLLKNVLL